ncbi:MAG TPA: sigma-70 family RNA polymerase sigma factor, partial [Actinomycetota bacterium]|nr:sigma-70 family RNA polymerase sigma factor [Actinomycetota bacterium]
MRFRAPATDARHEDILELEPLLRRVVGARVRHPDTADDLVQEALARVIAARGRLDDEAVTPYAIVTARNLIASRAREEERGRRHRPRLVDLSEPERPEDVALRQEEAAAVEVALAGLPDHERAAVVAHEIEGIDTATLAQARSSTPGAVGVQLARTRARLRLDYVLALRRVELPTPRCRPVLLALSAGRPAPPAGPGRRRPPHAVPDLRLAEPAAGRAAPLDRGAAAAAGRVVAVAAGPGLGAAPAGPG